MIRVPGYNLIVVLKCHIIGLQERWIREWLQKRMGSSPEFKITFYCGRYDNAFKSIFPVGDLTNYIPDDEVGLPRPSTPCTLVYKRICWSLTSYSVLPGWLSIHVW